MKAIILFALAGLLTGISLLFQQNRILKAERDRHTGNVETLMKEVKRYEVRDSLNAVSVSALNLTVDELKKYRAEDAKLIKELKLRPKDVEYITNTEVKTKDSLIYKIDSVGCFHYQDKWLKVDACVGDSSMTIESRDSLVMVVHRISKYRLLWWRWGTKGYKVEVVNFNPRSEIEYNEIIQIK